MTTYKHCYETLEGHIETSRQILLGRLEEFSQELKEIVSMVEDPSHIPSFDWGDFTTNFHFLMEDLNGLTTLSCLYMDMFRDPADYLGGYVEQITVNSRQH
jgi:hypothetical protein